MAKEKEVCLGCSKKFNKTDNCLQCTVCGLWIHKTCSGLSDELFDFMEKQIKQTGITYWACRPCTVYAQGMNHRMKNIEDKLGSVERGMTENKDGVRKLNKQVDNIREELKNKDSRVERAVREAEKRMEDEWREREAKRMNVVFHNIGEAEDKRATGKERQEWDRKSCMNIFNALKLKISEDGIRFCRRVGEKKEGPRPLVVGLWAEVDKCQLLRNAKNLEKTIFKDVTVGPDLTKRQREEEAEMRAEADRRNETELTEEDMAKNLKWAVVGDRGKKSLIKTVVREQRTGGGRDWRATRDTGATQKRQQQGTVVGGRYQPNKVKSPAKKALTESEGVTEDEEEMETESEPEMEPPRAVAGKKGRKRKTRSPGTKGAAGEPPEKR